MKAPLFFRCSHRTCNRPASPVQFSAGAPLSLTRRVRNIVRRLSRVRISVTPPTCRDTRRITLRLRPTIHHRFNSRTPTVRIMSALSTGTLTTTDHVHLHQSTEFASHSTTRLLRRRTCVRMTATLGKGTRISLPVLTTKRPNAAHARRKLTIFTRVLDNAVRLGQFRQLTSHIFTVRVTMTKTSFVRICHCFLRHASDPSRSFRDTQQIFQNNVVDNKTPFAGSIICLCNLLRIDATVHTVFDTKQTSYLQLLFYNGLSILSLPTLYRLATTKLYHLPRFIPP